MTQFRESTKQTASDKFTQDKRLAIEKPGQMQISKQCFIA